MEYPNCFCSTSRNCFSISSTCAATRLLGCAGQRLLVVQPGVHEPFVARAHGRERRDQIAIIQAAIGLGCFGQSVGETHQQMFALVGELFGNLNLKEQRRGIELVCGTRLLVLARLLQIGAVAGTIQRHLALLAAALRADAAVHGWTEALLLANLANRAAQGRFLLSASIMALDDDCRCSNWQSAVSLELD